MSMNKKLFTLLVLFSLFTKLYSDDSQFENKKITSIVIEIEDLPKESDFKTKSVESKLKIKVGEPFSQSTFDQDLKNLSKDYDRIEPKIKVENDDVAITLKVWIRPMISDITITGSTHYSQNKLKKELSVEPFTLFNRQTFNKNFHKLKEFYIKKGYFETQLDYKLVKNHEKNEVAIVIEVNEGRSGRINQVHYEGFTSKEIAKLKEQVHIKKFNPLMTWFTHQGIYHEEMIEYDKVKILEFLRDQGFANAKLEIDVTESEKNNRIGIDIKADKGEFFTIGSVTFSGNQDFDNEVIQSKILIKEGDPYSPQKIQDTANAISEFYGKKGYIDASISYEPHLIEEQHAYSLNFIIDEGAPYKVGLIKIMGNNRTFSKVILRETHLEPGNVFDTKMLEATRKRLENVGYYKHVNVYPSTSSIAESIKTPVRDVNVEVLEGSTGSFGLNVGFSTVDSVYGGIELSEKNFNIAGLTQLPQKGISALRGGGEYLKIQSSIGIKLTDYSLNWMKPYFFDSLWSIGVNLDKNFSRIQSESYNIESFTSTLNAFYPLNAFVDFQTYYRVRNIKLHVSANAPESLQNQKSNNGIVSAVGVGLQYETRNSSFRPTRGLTSNLLCEYAGVGGNFTFFKFAYNNAFYQPAGPFVFKTKANFNFIQPISKTKIDNIPLGEKFFLATDICEVRGYKPFAIGPQFANGDPQGGTTSVVLSQEVMVPLIPKFIDLFVFFDAGVLTDKRSFFIDTFRTSTGAGARLIAMPNMPLMLGWGYPINPANRKNDRQGFFLSLGGHF